MNDKETTVGEYILVGVASIIFTIGLIHSCIYAFTFIEWVYDLNVIHNEWERGELRDKTVPYVEYQFGTGEITATEGIYIGASHLQDLSWCEDAGNIKVKDTASFMYDAVNNCLLAK